MGDFILGIDPGKTGGWAIIDVRRRCMVAGGPLDFDGCDETMHKACIAWGVKEGLSERAQSAPGDRGAFEYGRSFGRTESAARFAGVKLYYCAPAWWKGKTGCPVDKKKAVAFAERIFPELPLYADNGPRGGKDTGTAEAALIGWVFARPSLRAEVEKNNAARQRAKRRKRVVFDF